MSTNEKDYGAKVADLIEGAFKNLSAAHATSPASPADMGVDRAMAQLYAAQTVATLGLATEVRAVGLLLAAGRSVTPAADVAREAYTAAAIMLGLVEDHRGPADGDPTPEGKDPADAEVEL